MFMELKNYFAQDVNGNILPDANVYIYEVGTTTLINSLKKRNGDVLTNPFKTDSNGLIQFSAPNGIYDMRVASGGRDYTLQVYMSDATEQIFNIKKQNGVDAVGNAEKSPYYRIPELSFGTGARITARKQCLLNNIDECYYEYIGDIPVGGYVVEAGSIPDVANWINVGDATLRTEIKWALNQYHLVKYDDINTILTLTIGPITIYAPTGRWASPRSWRDGITLIGERMPLRSADGARLENGTVFEGSVDILKKHRGSITNCGFDIGTYVVSTGHTKGNALGITNTPSDQQTVEQSPITGWNIDMVSGLTVPPSDVDKYHGILLEGMDNPTIGTVVGYGGIASVVIKNKNGPLGKLIGYDGDPYTVTIKSNKYAPVEDLTIDSIMSFGGGGAVIVSDDPAAVGAALKKVTIGHVVVRGGKRGFQGTATNEQKISDLTIGSLIISGVDGAAGGFGDGCERVKIISHNISGCANGFAVVGDADVDLGDGSSNGNGQHGYIISSPNASAGKISAHNNATAGTYITTKTFKCDSYQGDDHALMRPNTNAISELITGVVSTNGIITNELHYRMHSAGVCALKGQVERLCSVNDILLIVPEQITPMYGQSAIVTIWNGSEFKSASIVINTNGEVRATFSLTDSGSYIDFSSARYNYL